MSFKIRCQLPSKQVVYCNEINNDLYLALHKYVLNEDLIGFYNELDLHISETVPNISSFNLIDRVYIYIALRAYSISDSIELRTNSFLTGNSYSLFDTLDVLQKEIIEPTEFAIDTKKGKALFKVDCPTCFEQVDKEILPDILSSVKNIILDSNEFHLGNSKDFLALNYLITPENYNKLSDLILKKYNINIIFVKGKIELPILSHFTYRFIAESLYFSDLDNVYTLSYTLLKHLNLSLSDFKQMTPVESSLIFSKLVKDKEEERKEAEKQQRQNNSRNSEFIF